MEQLKKQVRRAQRSLGLQRFVEALGWCCFVTLLAALAVILVDKFRPLGVEAWIWGAGGLGLGFLSAVIWSIIRGRGPIDAAIEIDRRFGLKERVSSALAMSADDLQTASGQALVEDATERVHRIDVNEHFAVSPGRQLLLPLVPAIAAILVALFVPQMINRQAQAKTNPEVKKQIEKSTETLKKKLLEQKEKAQQKGLEDALEFFKKLEEDTDNLANTAGQKKKALAKLNDLGREIRKRQQELGGNDELQKQFQQLKNVGQGPADKFLQAIKKGDFKQAMKELGELKSKLSSGEMTAQQREQLANQMNEMQNKLQKLVDAQREAERELQKRADQARQEGRNEEAERLEEQLENLQQQRQQMNQLQDLANRMGQCAQCMRDGQLGDASNLLDQLQSDVANLQQQLDEMDMLNEALQELAQCRNQMTCPCGGLGCDACMGGMGLGRGRGRGDRPEEKNPTNFYNTQANVKTGRGAASVVGEVDGPIYKGDFQQAVRDEFSRAKGETADPLAGQQVPHDHRQHVEEYFDQFREGQ